MSKVEYAGGGQETAAPAKSARHGGPAEVLAAHQQAGRYFEAAGVRSFVRDQGTGPAVLCVHGMIGSSFLYRKVLTGLADRGLRGIAFDLPGFGLADRPPGYDYSWTGLGKFCVAAVDELGLGQFHLVVHDIGGPVGFELAAAMAHRVASLTMLNTTVDVTAFKSPWSMEPFRHRGLGELWMRSLNAPMFRFLMGLQGIGDTSAVSRAELKTYLALIKGPDPRTDVPADHAQHRAHTGKAGAVPRGRPRRALSGAGGLGSRRPDDDAGRVRPQGSGRRGALRRVCHRGQALPAGGPGADHRREDSRTGPPRLITATCTRVPDAHSAR
jgi:pimeloyl-ACP methyl ester carboxylesterase